MTTDDSIQEIIRRSGDRDIQEIIISNDVSEDLNEEEDGDIDSDKEKDTLLDGEDDILEEELMEHVHDGVYHDNTDLELGDEERDGRAVARQAGGLSISCAGVKSVAVVAVIGGL